VNLKRRYRNIQNELMNSIILAENDFFYLLSYVFAFCNLSFLLQVQFVVGIAHAIQSIYVRCPFPMWMQWLFIIYGFTILGLFLNFYFRAYVKPPKDQVSFV